MLLGALVLVFRAGFFTMATKQIPFRFCPGAVINRQDFTSKMCPERMVFQQW
jgi:hypothetical protein